MTRPISPVLSISFMTLIKPGLYLQQILPANALQCLQGHYHPQGALLRDLALSRLWRCATGVQALLP